MASTVYTDYQLPAISAAWLNDVNALVYGTNSLVVNTLQVGPLTTIKTAPFIGNAKIYHETKVTLDQTVLFKAMTGTVASTDLGRTWQMAVIQNYDGQTAAGLNPVTVAATQLALTTNVGSTGFASRCSVVNQQNVLSVCQTDTSLGPNEYANTVMLLDPTLGVANAGNTMWQNDWTSYGPKDGPEYSLYGTTQMICKWNVGAAVSGQQSVGMLVTTRPKGGAGAQNRANLFTFPVDVGLGIAGFSGQNNTTNCPGGNSANATQGFRVGLQVGGLLGPWLNEGIYTGGSKIGTGVRVSDFVTAGVYVGTAHVSSTQPLSIVTTSDSGTASIGTAAPDFTTRLYVNGIVGIADGTWNGGHLKNGPNHMWHDSTGVARIKLGTPAAESDGHPLAMGWAGAINFDGSVGKLPTGWSVVHNSIGSYTVTTFIPTTLNNYAVTATVQDPSPGFVRQTQTSGTYNFTVLTVDGSGALADRSFQFTVIKI